MKKVFAVFAVFVLMSTTLVFSDDEIAIAAAEAEKVVEEAAAEAEKAVEEAAAEAEKALEEVSAEWECPNCGSVQAGNFCSNCGTARPSGEWECTNCGTINNGNFCTNCGTPKESDEVGEGETTISKTEVAVGGASIPEETESKKEKEVRDYVKNYTGLNLSSVGYTSMGGDRRDYYGDSNLILTLVSPDGVYIDPDDDEQLQSYTIVSQMPAGGTEIIFYYNGEDKVINSTYNEIILAVQRVGDKTETPELTDILPSVSKETQYMKDYVGRNLASVGYTAMNGNRYDTFGSNEQRIQISILDENGAPVDLGSEEKLKYYTVTSQSLEPNSELVFMYSTDSDGNEKLSGQSVSTIQITAQMSEVGARTLEQMKAEEEALRASGALKELYEGTYKVGVDLEPGNYKLKEISDSVSIYTYRDEDAYNNDEGEWDYIYGEDDVACIALKDEMYFKVGDGAVKAIRSDFPNGDEQEMELYEGIYRVGTDIVAGPYEVAPITDACSIYIYQSEEDLKADEKDWDYLYGKDDKEYYSLQDGMIIEISDGAVKVVRK